MPNLPSVELLESIHTFPGVYVYKVIGADDHTFAARVIAAVRAEVSPEYEPGLQIRRTPAGRHVCVTIEPHVSDAEQVRTIYERLCMLDGLVMIW